MIWHFICTRAAFHGASFWYFFIIGQTEFCLSYWLWKANSEMAENGKRVCTHGGCS
jgi:hypothetical protein